MSVNSRWFRGRRRPRVASLLALVLLVPTVGLSVLAWSVGSDRAHERTASSHVQADAVELQGLMEARAALTDEWVQSAAIVYAADMGVSAAALTELVGVDVPANVRAARGRGAAESLARQYPDLAQHLGELTLARDAVDTGRPGATATVDSAFIALTQHVDEIWNHRLTDARHVIELSTSLRRGSDLHQRLQVIDETFLALKALLDRAKFGNLVLTGGFSSAAAVGLIEAGGRYGALTTDLADELGPRAASSWRAWRADPNTAHVEAVIGTAANAAATGIAPSGVDVNTYSALLTHGIDWIAGFTAVNISAAVDLADLAREQRAAASRALVLQVAGVGGLVLGSLAAGVALSSAVARPLRRLAGFAHQVGVGNFGAPPPRPAGPREIAQTTVAIADMTATVAALDAYVIELADDPSSSVLDVPLPGQTGRALQTTVNQLRHSMRAADENRQQLEEIATHDGLTGVLTRVAAIDAIDRDLTRARRAGTTFAVLFIDVDGLKAVNDTYGHEIGDQAIRLTADALRATTRGSDVIARFGGDEFIVAVDAGGGEAEAVRLAERIRAAVAGQSLVVEDRRVPVHCSIGVACAQPHDTTDDVIQHADHALYEAKRRGRDKVCRFTPAPTSV